MDYFSVEDDDIRLAGLPLWLDARRRRPFGFVSHAHADHVGPLRKIVCTRATLDLIGARSSAPEAITPAYGEQVDIAGAGVTLHPAGHVLGSAQIIVETKGLRLLYTGDFRLGDSLTAEPAEALACDVMLMECTYGHPRYAFPGREEVMRMMADFVEGSFDRSATPVFLAYSLGKAQEAIAMLDRLGYGVLAHPAVYKICKVYERHGIAFPQLDELAYGPVGRRAVVCPPQRAAREKLGRIGPQRSAALTGWALDERCRHLFGADECIPFSDHCDFESLVRAARESGAGKILTHHGDADRFAEYLRAEGLDAEPLVEPPQARLF